MIPIKETMTTGEIEAYKKGVKDGEVHEQPSRDTLDKFKENANEHKEMRERLDILPVIHEKIITLTSTANKTHKQATDTNGKLAEQEKKIAIMRAQITDEPEKKFASIWTQRAVYAMLGLIVAGVVGQWMNIIFINNKNSIDKLEISEIVNSAIFEYDKSFTD